MNEWMIEWMNKHNQSIRKRALEITQQTSNVEMKEPKKLIKQHLADPRDNYPQPTIHKLYAQTNHRVAAIPRVAPCPPAPKSPPPAAFRSSAAAECPARSRPRGARAGCAAPSPLLYVFAEDALDREVSMEVEADTFFAFNTLASELQNLYIKHMDSTSLGLCASKR